MWSKKRRIQCIPAISAVLSGHSFLFSSGNDTVYLFYTPPVALGVAKGFYETQRQMYQGSHTSGTLLKTVLTCYNGNTTSCANPSTLLPPITQKNVYTTLAGMTQSSLSETTYDNYGDVTEDEEYDFSGTLISNRVVTYGTYSSGNCTPIGNNIISRVCTDLTQVGTTVLAQTNNSYDSHGNLTSTSRLVGGSTYLTSSATYNSNGTVSVATDVNGAQTTNTAFTCNGNFPTSVSEPLGLSKSMTWDCNGGVMKALTDENNQTATYAYVNPTTGLGDPFYRPVSLTDQLGNVTNYYYTTTFSCTPNPAYPNGAYVEGRLAEAFTGPSSAKTTDIAYCYSPRGETTDEFESTPNSKGYYHTTASYWANGALSALIGVPSHSGWTFGVDGEGRPNSALDGTTNLVPVNGTTYNAASQPTGVTLGSGDSDTYLYDPNTGRMTTYQYKIGSTPKYVTGTLGWNPNWSLGSLTITDAFDKANAQTCAYSHDDLSRLQSASCGPTSANGATWGQTFSYDAFGNISKSGSITFAASYLLANGTTNNQEQTVSSCAPTYDANGNLTTDCTFIPSYTYAWDSDANTVGINLSGSAPISITYDAFDRAVEEDNSGTYKQILYSPIGKLALMAKQVANNVFLPLPGGEQATYTNGTIRFRHYDWLGSARFESNMSEQEYGDVAYAPFGETYSILNTPYLSFTGQQQDTVSGLYDFLYREYNPTQGRWISPDRAGLGAVDVSNPQSWNRYAYVNNNPLSDIDPSGLACYPLEIKMFGNCGFVGGQDGGDLFGESWLEFTLMNIPFGDSLVNVPSAPTWVPNPNYDPNDPNSVYGALMTTANWVAMNTGFDLLGANSWVSGTGVNATAAANNGSWLQQGLNYLKNHPVFISVNEILAAQITVQWSTKTVCANLGAGASVPPTKAVTVGVYNNGNMSNWTNVLSSWGYSFGANLIAGYQASTNSSGTIGGPTISGVGLSGSYTYGGCTTVP